MKALLRKIPALLAMLISVFSFIMYVQYLLGAPSDYWIGSAIFAYLSMPFFFADAIISLVRANKKDDSKFNYFLTIVLVVAIPIALFLAGDGRDYLNVIWNVYYLFMFVLEVVSIKRICDTVRANKNKAK